MSVNTISIEWANSIASYETYLLASGCSPKTVRLRKDWIARYARWIDEDPFSVKDTAVVEWSAHQEWSQSTRRSAHQSVKSFYQWALGQGLTDRMPIIPSVRKAVPSPHPASDAAVASCLLSRDWRVKLAARLSVELGMRRGEVACVNVDRDLIDSSDGAALIVHGKGGKTRVIPITESLAGELRKYQGFVFPGNVGGHISPEWLGKLLSRSMPAGVSMHALRHRFTTRAYRATRDLVAVQRVLGHASPETTLVYLQMSDDALRRVVEAAA